ncbi:hypothetical protein CRG98_005785 [Punica granatum]|uniref:Uncharacterized protein n=1 Tax=Punica granatum TaxID=22663 RepID=A0A2I0KZB4_PUNGR|nr:hypothetical protein CRG98_005785 [Punica granatum]
MGRLDELTLGGGLTSLHWKGGPASLSFKGQRKYKYLTHMVLNLAREVCCLHFDFYNSAQVGMQGVQANRTGHRFGFRSNRSNWPVRSGSDNNGMNWSTSTSAHPSAWASDNSPLTGGHVWISYLGRPLAHGLCLTPLYFLLCSPLPDDSSNVVDSADGFGAVVEPAEVADGEIMSNGTTWLYVVTQIHCILSTRH